HWSRELKALGHTVKLMPPAYVKPYVKRQKNDATDAEAICKAVTRANMRFVATKRTTETMKRLGPQNRVRLLREGERELCPDTGGHCSHKSKLHAIRPKRYVSLLVSQHAIRPKRYVSLLVSQLNKRFNLLNLCSHVPTKRFGLVRVE